MNDSSKDGGTFRGNETTLARLLAGTGLKKEAKLTKILEGRAVGVKQEVGGKRDGKKYKERKDMSDDEYETERKKKKAQQNLTKKK